MTRWQIQALVRDVVPLILPKYKRSTKELSGWIINGYLIWLDGSYCDSRAVYLEDDVSILMHAIDALSFHSHPIKDDSGKECISGADRVAASAFGQEVVITAKGIYLLVPYQKLRVATARQREDNLHDELDNIKDLSIRDREMLFESKASRLFKCHCWKILDLE
jgi:hypothetical protein